MAGHPHEGARQDTQAASRCRLLAQADLGKDPDQAGLAPAGAGPGDGHDAERRGQPLSGFLAPGLGATVPCRRMFTALRRSQCWSRQQARPSPLRRCPRRCSRRLSSELRGCDVVGLAVVALVVGPLRQHGPAAAARRRGLEISVGKMSHLWAGQPVSVRLDDLDVLCAVLGCEPGDLLIRDPSAAETGGR